MTRGSSSRGCTAPGQAPSPCRSGATTHMWASCTWWNLARLGCDGCSVFGWHISEGECRPPAFSPSHGADEHAGGPSVEGPSETEERSCRSRSPWQGLPHIHGRYLLQGPCRGEQMSEGRGCPQWMPCRAAEVRQRTSVACNVCFDARVQT